MPINKLEFTMYKFDLLAAAVMEHAAASAGLTDKEGMPPLLNADFNHEVNYANQNNDLDGMVDQIEASNAGILILLEPRFFYGGQEYQSVEDALQAKKEADHIAEVERFLDKQYADKNNKGRARARNTLLSFLTDSPREMRDGKKENDNQKKLQSPSPEEDGEQEEAGE